MKSRTILISGGGIAGLTAALALARRGFRAEVHERVAQFEATGAGIQLSPNALRVLEELDVLAEIRRTATTVSGISIEAADSKKTIATVPLGAHAIERFGISYLTVHRSDLHRALALACEKQSDIHLHTNSKITDASSHENGVSALCQQPGNVETKRAAGIVFADGVHSSAREAVFDAGPSKHSGMEVWRALIPADACKGKLDLDYTHLVWAHGAHAVLYPVRNNRFLNAVVCVRAEGETPRKSRSGDVSDLVRLLQGWHGDYLDMFRNEADWSIWPLYEVPAGGRWYRGNMVMIGDAAHAMLPFAAQGAAAAIEDAAVYARMVERYGLGEAAGKAFQKARLPRINRLQRLARSNGRIYHMGWPLTMARNAVVRLTPANRLLDRQSWIYDYDPLKA